MPHPSSRKSTTAIVPIESAKPRMWRISRRGKDHSLLFRGLVVGSYRRKASRGWRSTLVNYLGVERTPTRGRPTAAAACLARKVLGWLLLFILVLRGGREHFLAVGKHH